jgi:Prophage minor tail protein Z (GPZ)
MKTMVERRTAGITFSAEAYLDRLNALQKPRLDQAVALALVDTAKSGIAKGAGLIARRTGLKSATVKQRIYYDPVRVGDYQVTIRSSRRPIPLIEFASARQVGAGVRTSVWGRSQIIGSAFIATMPSGHRGVYRRTGRHGRRGKRYLERIKQLWGPTIYGTFATPDVQSVIAAMMRARLQTALARRIASEQRRRR